MSTDYSIQLIFMLHEELETEHTHKMYPAPMNPDLYLVRLLLNLMETCSEEKTFDYVISLE